ncbi:Phosphoenolpyruvate synthase [Rubripirellula tenax]|uniref:Phosphoenolpyruvate synthase n=1 Tax=Rubripirellula tenax TaxID=2528015 RepID=A0A5C6EN25_9BACT|nr:putative PEP-binding protein [Rubripirellula tenax]TWU50542.1 Phosphoenolpyruvate synthase [Rubripirellula tenax]
MWQRNYVKIHPQALLDFGKLDDASQAAIESVTKTYDDEPSYFVDKLAAGIAMICAAFYPKDVIVRLSEFETNEYANVIGGEAYEPVEANPMIGFRDASRFYHPSFQEAFGLECKAVQKVRPDMGLRKLKLMIPFCRTIEEGQRVQEEMAKHDGCGLFRAQFDG